MEEWTVVDTKQRKSEKQAQRRQEKQELQKKIQTEREKRWQREKEELERMSHSGWGPGDSDEEEKPRKQQKKKKEKKPIFEVSVRGDTGAPVAQTVFSTFNEMAQAKARKNKQKQIKAAAKRKEEEEAMQAEMAQQATPKKKKKKAPKKPSLLQVSSNIDLDSMKVYLDELATKYPDMHDIQLRSLAGHLEQLFGKVNLGPSKVQEEKSFERKLEIPYCYLSTEVSEAIISWLQAFPEPNAFISFLNFLLGEIIATEKRHNTSGVGLRLLASLLARSVPSAVRECTKSNEFQQRFCGDTPASYAPVGGATVLTLNTKLLRLSVVPTIVWFFGQTIDDTPGLALTLWLQFLLPFLFLEVPEPTKALILAYIQHLYTRREQLDEEGMDQTVVQAAIERVMVFRTSLSISAFKKTDLYNIYNKLEELAVWRFRGNVHNYFPMWLKHAGSNVKSRREEALEKLVRCLGTDGESFNTWHAIYPRAVAQSSNLVLYIYHHWDRFTGAKSPQPPSQSQKQASKKTKQAAKTPTDEEENGLASSEGSEEAHETGEKEREEEEEEEAEGGGAGDGHGKKWQGRIDHSRLLGLVRTFLTVNQQIAQGIYKMRVKVKKGSQPQPHAVDPEDLKVCNLTCTKLLKERGPQFLLGGKKGGQADGQYLDEDEDELAGSGNLLSAFVYFLFLMILLCVAAIVLYRYLSPETVDNLRCKVLHQCRSPDHL